MSEVFFKRLLSSAGQNSTTAWDISVGADPFVDKEVDILSNLNRNQSSFKTAPATERIDTPPFSASDSFPSSRQSFDCSDFDPAAAASGYYRIPPDSTAANGASALIAVVHGAIHIISKTSDGTASAIPARNESLDAFFAPTEMNGAFDAKVAYDPASDKFVIVAMAKGSGVHTSHVLVAESTDGAALQWNYKTIIATKNVGDTLSWADFPGIAVDGQGTIYITTNLFSLSGGN